MRYFRCFIFLCLNACVSTVCASEEPDLPVLTPTMLNAHPEQYDKKVVRVRGYVVVGFEQRFLFTDKSDYNAPAGYKHCITLTNAGRILANEKKFNKKYVVLKGAFIQDLGKMPYVQLGGCNRTAIDLDNEFPMDLSPAATRSAETGRAIAALS